MKTVFVGERRDVRGFMRALVTVTPSHGSEERRQMLLARYRESRQKQREAEKAGAGFEQCIHKGRADHFRQLLKIEYGEDIDG